MIHNWSLFDEYHCHAVFKIKDLVRARMAGWSYFEDFFQYGRRFREEESPKIKQHMIGWRNPQVIIRML